MEKVVIDLLADAMNNHDVESMVNCFTEDYDSVQPIHPARAFKGREQVKENWSGIFKNVPDFSARVERHIYNDSTIWSEWEWKGTKKDHSLFHMRGIIILGITGNKIAWARLFMEPVDVHGAAITEAMEEIRGALS